MAFRNLIRSLVLAACFLPPVLGADQAGPAASKPASADAVGTWKWSYTAGDGAPLEARIVLRRVEGKLEGVARGADGLEVPLEQLSFATNQLRFELSRVFAGKKITTQYRGTITGDQLKGQVLMGKEGSGRSRDWEAVREKPTPPAQSP